MWYFRTPTAQIIHDFLEQQTRESFSYKEIGCSQDSSPAGYDLDHNRILLGNGRVVFEAACDALKRWAMFPGAWTRIEPASTPMQAGNVVVMVAHVFGLWWLNACRIVYVLNENAPLRRFGFAYGTLPGHVECGEECFSVAWYADDTVWYAIRSFSRPRYWLARLGYPLVRRLQRRFVRESQVVMQQAVEQVANRSMGAGAS